ncbi:uncharacterized protein LTR77_000837 [Saxophila tyrrhenica]|uniref:LisH domain-containing protein n=1 Tax=Saxophila tyrrhenica TaxID=1690608 RepID=A0AAV9PR26_9PEZI|nr:hypothetical protein LTR77_000837 [Saxophila tyrrhenica]
MPPSGGTLHSDHVNYLILRYLQEAGHEKAATAFYTDWHRGPEHRDPESYPFAPAVRRGELISVIQDGLYHDELLSRVKNNERKFLFTGANATERAREWEAPGRSWMDEDTSRPSTSGGGKRKGRPPAMRPPDEFPTPAPKRQRRSEGSEGVHLNGDAMDVDAASGDGEAEEDGEPVSPAMGEDGEELDVPQPRYDSMDVAVQTDFKAGPKTSTMSWKVDRPGATIYHSMFNPDSSAENGRTLMTVGENLCRFYQVPESPDEVKQIARIDQPSLPPNSVITASTWHPEGHTAVCAVDTIRNFSDGRSRSDQQILSHSRHGGTSASFLLPPLLDPPGLMLAMRYSSAGNYLLVIRMNPRRGMVLIYDTSPNSRSQEPVAWRISEDRIFDAFWDDDELKSFVLCGEHDLIERWALRDSAPTPVMNGVTDEDMPANRLTRLDSHSSDPQSLLRWDKMTHDNKRTYAFASIGDDRSTLKIPNLHSQNSYWRAEGIDVSGQITAFAFRPLVDAPKPALLLVTVDNGACHLYSHEDPANGVSHRKLSFHLSEGPALALAWSHDGQYVAIGGHELVEIWDIDSLVELVGRPMSYWAEAKESSHAPLVTWRLDVATAKLRNGEHEEDKPLSEPSLSWSADGERLAFAVDKQIAVISFRPPLSRELPPHENGVATTNGHDHAP